MLCIILYGLSKDKRVMKEEKGTAVLREKSKWSVVLGVVMLIGITIGYIGHFDRIYEMTFLSNFFSGMTLIFAALHIKVTGRDIKHFLYFDATMLLLVVLGMCVGFAPLATFAFPSIIVHFINPILMAVFYFTFCDARNTHYVTAISALCFPFLYYLFMIAFGRITGDTVYTYFDPNKFGAGMLALWGAVAALSIIVVAFIVMRINRHVFSKRDKKAAVAESCVFGEDEASISAQVIAMPSAAPAAIPVKATGIGDDDIKE